MKPRKKRRGLTLAEIPILDHGVCGNFECGKILRTLPTGAGGWAARRSGGRGSERTAFV